VDEMKYIILNREDDNFSDILKDKNIKKYFDLKIKYHKNLILGCENLPEDIVSYIMLKYGDDIKDKNNYFIDRNPKPFIDYMPDSKRPPKFKKL
jgi:hypothetical protein